MEKPDEKPSDLVSNTERGISQITESAVAESATDLFQFMTDQQEQIAEPVQLHFELNDIEHSRQRKWPRVSVLSDKDDVPCESNHHLLKELFTADIGEESELQKEYSSLTEEASNIGEERPLNHAEYSEGWLHQHAKKLEENMEGPSEVANEMDSEDLSENLDNLDEMISNEDDKETQTKEQDQPLYKGSPITVGISMLLIMTVAMRHGMTGEALQDILTLVTLHCISPNYCIEGVRRFKQYFTSTTSPLVFHHYCSHCFLYLDDKRAETCPNSLCQKPLQGLGRKSFFIEIPIASQLQDLFRQASIWTTSTTYRFYRQRTANNALGDIYDGALYREHWDSGFLKDHRNISFIYNTDGVPIFKSSKYSLWSLFLAINELPSVFAMLP